VYFCIFYYTAHNILCLCVCDTRKGVEGKEHSTILNCRRIQIIVCMVLDTRRELDFLFFCFVLREVMCVVRIFTTCGNCIFFLLRSTIRARARQKYSLIGNALWQGFQNIICELITLHISFCVPLLRFFFFTLYNIGYNFRYVALLLQ
jgi:hypothetical protein